MPHLLHCLKLAAGMMGTRRALTGPLWAQVGLANPCNHRCIMCWDHPSRVADDEPFPTDAARDFYARHPDLHPDHGFMPMSMLEDLADDLRRLGTRRVEFVGRGEPTLHPRFGDALAAFKDRGFRVGLATNGSRLDDDLARGLVELGLDRVVISMDAGRRETYPRVHTTSSPEDYDRLLERLRFLRELKRASRKSRPEVMLSFVISRVNVHEAPLMLERAAEVAAELAVFKYAVPHPAVASIEPTVEQKRAFSRQVPSLVGRAREVGVELKLEPPVGDLTADAAIYHHKLRTVYSRIPCYIGWFFTLVTADGIVSPCCQCMSAVGDLRRQGFADVWRSDAYERFRLTMKRLPRHGRAPKGCACDECAFEKLNATVYNALHFWRPVRLHGAQREFGIRQLLPAILGARTLGGARRRD